MSSSQARLTRSSRASTREELLQTSQKSQGQGKSMNAGHKSEAPIDSTSKTLSGAPFTPAQKRKASDGSGALLASAKKLKQEAASSPSSEKRLHKFRSKPPQIFHDVYGRAMQQRFYVLKRTRCGTEECPEEVLEMTGSTGNVYTVHIARQPQCNCPHAASGHQCKHIFYVLKKVLNAPFEIVYQLALLSSELRDIFAAAPPISEPKEAKSDKRKPVEGDCPICYCELEDNGAEAVVWCQAACGQNIHEQCFQMWARTKTGDVTCPMCRSVWQGDEEALSRVRLDQGEKVEGYVNVAAQLGISRERDESTYPQFNGRPQYWYHQRRAEWNMDWGGEE